MTRPVSLVSGAASGIGRSLCRTLHRAGHRLVLVDVDAAGLERTARDFGMTGDAAVVLRPHDVRSAVGWDAIVRETLDRFGRSTAPSTWRASSGLDTSTRWPQRTSSSSST